jgi:hypothetical protein
MIDRMMGVERQRRRADDISSSMSHEPAPGRR